MIKNINKNYKKVISNLKKVVLIYFVLFRKVPGIKNVERERPPKFQ
jgi:hypothetical protein